MINTPAPQPPMQLSSRSPDHIYLANMTFIVTLVSQVDYLIIAMMNIEVAPVDCVSLILQ